MSDETPDSLIPYDTIVQEALRAVVQAATHDDQLTGARIDTGQGSDVDLMGHQYDRFTQGQFVEPATQFAGLRVPPGEIVKKRVEDRPLFDWTACPPA